MQRNGFENMSVDDDRSGYPFVDAQRIGNPFQQLLQLSLDRLFDTLLRRFAGPLLLLPFDLRLRHGRLLRSCDTCGEQEEDR